MVNVRGGRLENELILQQFDVIEKKVESLIEALKSLETTNKQLEENIKQLNMELQEKKEAEKSNHEERDLIRSKVDSLLARLEKIAEP